MNRFFSLFFLLSLVLSCTNYRIRRLCNLDKNMIIKSVKTKTSHSLMINFQLNDSSIVNFLDYYQLKYYFITINKINSQIRSVKEIDKNTNKCTFQRRYIYNTPIDTTFIFNSNGKITEVIYEDKDYTFSIQNVINLCDSILHKDLSATGWCSYLRRENGFYILSYSTNQDGTIKKDRCSEDGPISYQIKISGKSGDFVIERAYYIFSD